MQNLKNQFVLELRKARINVVGLSILASQNTKIEIFTSCKTKRYKKHAKLFDFLLSKMCLSTFSLKFESV